MTPREHYEEAERLIALEEQAPQNQRERLQMLALIHARLAVCPDWSVHPLPAP